MTREQFHARLSALDLTTTDFARLTQCSPKTVADWGARYGVPYHARLILVLLEQRGGAHGLLGRPVTR
jgi:DNA-binding transcriptional regulator YiaG